MRKLALLGSTGSIGVSTLKLVREFPDKFQIHGMVAGRNLALLAKQIREFSPAAVAIQREQDVPRLEKRDFLLFMVQRPDDQVYFYFSTLRECLKKAFVSIPSKNLVLPLDPLEAESRFRQEVRYWGERIDEK